MEETTSNKFLKEFVTGHSEFLDDFPMAICRISAQGSIVYCNNKFAEILKGGPAKTLFGKTVVDLFGDKSVFDTLTCLFLDTDVIRNLPICLKTISGEDFWCWVSARRVRDEDGRPVFWDTCLEQVDPDLQREPWVPPADHPLDLEIHLDLKGNILNVDFNTLKIFGCTEDALIGQSLREFIVPEKVDEFLWLLYDVMEKGNAERIIFILDKLGETHQIFFTAGLIRREGRPDRIKVNGLDFQKALEKEKLFLQKERFQGVLEMVGAVSFSLKGPLGALNHLIEEWRLEVQPGETLYAELEKIQHQLETLIGIYNKVKNVRKYRSMEYVAGVQILDIDASTG